MAIIFLANWRDIVRVVQIFQLSRVSTHDDNHVSAYTGQHLVFSLNPKEKFFPHRVNSLERFLILADNFRGIECDVIFSINDYQLYLAHGEEDCDANHYLEQLLKAEKKKFVYWIDLKNADKNNISALMKKLNELDSVYNVKDRFILEVYDHSIVPEIQSHGFKVSSFLHEAIEGISDQGKKNFINSSDFVSQEILFLDQLKTMFPEKQVIVWDVTFWHSFKLSRLQNIADDPKIAICLLNIKSAGYR